MQRAIRPLIQPLPRCNAILPLDLFRASQTQDVRALGQRKEVDRPLGKTFVGPDDKNAVISQVRLQVTQHTHLLRWRKAEAPGDVGSRRPSRPGSATSLVTLRPIAFLLVSPGSSDVPLGRIDNTAQRAVADNARWTSSTDKHVELRAAHSKCHHATSHE
jgi:hypothetical protein